MEQQTNQEFLKALLAGLSKPIAPSWRIQQFSDQKAFAVVIPYLDKVDVMRALDEHAIYGWQRDHFTIGQDVYCKIGVIFPDNTCQWRSDAGTGGSGIEVEKSKASDSFKRAGSNWGIGRNLSEVEVVRVNTNLPLVKGAPKPYVVDSKGNRVWDLEKFINDSIKSGVLKVENIFATPDPAEATPPSTAPTPAPETKTPTKSKAKEKAAPAEELPEKQDSAIQPSAEFDKPEVKVANPDEAEARKTALELYLKKDHSKVLAYIIKGKKIMSYSTVSDFVLNHDLNIVREIYAEINKTI